MKKQIKLTRLPDGTSLLFPFALISSLFLMWGFAHGLLDVLDKHFQDILHVTKAQSGFVQFSLYIGYLVMAVPAGIIIKKYGYKAGIITGLSLFAAGAFLFYPVAKLESFVPFLLALFVIACGLACLETSANPYSTVLGPKEYAARRINISQSFNGLGWILGPLIGGLLIFGANDNGDPDRFASMVQPYMMVGAVVVVLALVFLFVRLPEIETGRTEEIQEDPPMRHLLRHPAFVVAVIAEFLYVAAQTGVNSFFINYVTEAVPDLQNPVAGMMAHFGSFGETFMPRNPEQAASLILAIGGMGLFWIGRLSGSYLMKYIAPQRLLLVYGAANTLLVLLVIAGLGWVSVISLFCTYFFMSIMFPTIFALGLRDLGPLTKKGASFLVMAVAGGAFCPPVMGLLGDHFGMPVAFIIPCICFAFIAWYGGRRSTRTELQAGKKNGPVLHYQHH
ncbi:L-fucose:H+ symporter permease [Panacibacter sp. DH6]|uniref:L-fucose:H+ symporter permease n=1 Tax=Panacibacter microcysteis TaxID=2793269 RepID=A0A931H0F6_9BACT|nr:L-fucose:H+ symporter permease [Panacibacter microcysteis]MBG9378746.1 L-fucose:H+ symporter permease [Panacibacter microcysteis]